MGGGVEKAGTERVDRSLRGKAEGRLTVVSCGENVAIPQVETGPQYRSREGREGSDGGVDEERGECQCGMNSGRKEYGVQRRLSEEWTETWVSGRWRNATRRGQAWGWGREQTGPHTPSLDLSVL